MKTTATSWLVAVGFGLIASIACREPEPSNTIRVSGHVEATEVRVAPDVGGRLIELRVMEGDRVATGDLIGRLDATDAELQIARARAERAVSEAQLRALQAGARPEEIRQAQAEVQAAGAEADGATAELKAAVTDLERFEALLRANAGAEKERDDARTRVEVARERVRSARERVQAAREVVARLQAGSRREDLDVARARVEAADTQIALLEKSRSDALIKATAAGVVTQKLADAGEQLAPLMPVVVVTDLDNAWANLYVPEPMIPRITIGQTATVLTDAGDTIPGKVSYISPQAEFTPRNVQTADERSKLVYRIKVNVDNRAGILKVGMPVDAELSLP
ncbi:MAG: efflux RND transporter periplasmic adaptor subunit [Vicinamibacterales bacterium]